MASTSSPAHLATVTNLVGVTYVRQDDGRYVRPDTIARFRSPLTLAEIMEDEVTLTDTDGEYVGD